MSKTTIWTCLRVSFGRNTACKLVHYGGATSIVLAIYLGGCSGDVPPKSDLAGSGTETAGVQSSDQPSSESSLSQDDTPDALAKESVTQFWTAGKSNDIGKLMTLVDVPFMFDGAVVTEVDELRSEFEKFFEKREILSKLAVEIRESIAFETIPKNDMSGEVGDFLRASLTDGDQIVTADLLLPDRKLDQHAHYVRVRDGQPTIVGLLEVHSRD